MISYHQRYCICSTCFREDAVRNSPMQLVATIGSYSGHRHIIVAYGEHDPPEFHRQSRDMAAVSQSIVTSL